MNELLFLRERNKTLEESREKLNSRLSKFLTPDQIEALEKPPRKWSNESVIKALKIRFAVGVHGYNFLTSNNHPLPSNSTLTRRVRNFRVETGVMKNMLEPLKQKVETMRLIDR